MLNPNKCYKAHFVRAIDKTTIVATPCYQGLGPVMLQPDLGELDYTKEWLESCFEIYENVFDIINPVRISRYADNDVNVVDRYRCKIILDNNVDLKSLLARPKEIL